MMRPDSWLMVAEKEEEEEAEVVVIVVVVKLVGMLCNDLWWNTLKKKNWLQMDLPTDRPINRHMDRPTDQRHTLL